MNKPARRDGTPDRGRSNPAHKNTNQDSPRQGSGSRGSDNRSSGYQGSNPRSGDQRSSGYQGSNPRSGDQRSSGYQGSNPRGGSDGRSSGYQGSNPRGGSDGRSSGYQGSNPRGGSDGRSSGYQGSNPRGGDQRSSGYQGSNPRGGDQRSSGYQGSNPRGGSDGRSSGYQGSNPRGGSDGRSSGYQGSNPRGGDDSRSSGYQGSNPRGGSDGRSSGYQGSNPRGGSDGRSSGYQGSNPRSGDQRSSGYQGSNPRSGDQRSSGYQGSNPRGGSDSRSSGYQGSNPRDAAHPGSTQSSSTERGASSRGGYPRGGVQPPLSKRGKPKAEKPQRAPSVTPTISNAKPSRHQYSEGAGPTKLPAGEGMRLQKVLAQAGVASRRAAEELIEEGRVEVDGRIVVEQGLRVDPENAVVRVDGIRVVVKKDLVHIALNKPRGWQSTMSDDLGRPCIGDIVSERVSAGQRLFHVGRLDADTEGLILLTNDGDLAHRLMHPSFEVPKTYLATVSGVVDRNLGKTLKTGVELEDGPAKVDSYALLDVNQGKSLVKIVLHEGRKHIVRRLLEAVGHPVVRLVRTDIGPVALGDGRPGTLRVLGRGEVGGLYKAVGL